MASDPPYIWMDVMANGALRVKNERLGRILSVRDAAIDNLSMEINEQKEKIVALQEKIGQRNES